MSYASFDAANLLDVLREHEVTSFCAPPTVWRMLINADLSAGPGALREVVGAGEPLNPEVIEQVRRAWGLDLRDGYGQTEMTAAVGNTPGSPLKPGSMGRPLPGVPVVLVDPASGERVDGAGEGELCLDLSAHPLPLMTGYRGDAERHAEAMAGGWYHTGDVASRDADGWITYVGRTDDVFKASDYKISPFEVESVLIEHPAVAEAAVVPARMPCASRCRRPTSSSPPVMSRPRRPRARSSPMRARTSRRGSGSGGSSSPSCPRRSRARSAASSSGPARRSSPPATVRPRAPSGGTTCSPTSGLTGRAAQLGDGVEVPVRSPRSRLSPPGPSHWSGPRRASRRGPGPPRDRRPGGR